MDPNANLERQLELANAIVDAHAVHAADRGPRAPTNDRPTLSLTVLRTPFDLPDGYWRVLFEDGFECGIAPDGSVSS